MSGCLVGRHAASRLLVLSLLTLLFEQTLSSSCDRFPVVRTVVRVEVQVFARVRGFTVYCRDDAHAIYPKSMLATT